MLHFFHEVALFFFATVLPHLATCSYSHMSQIRLSYVKFLCNRLRWFVQSREPTFHRRLWGLSRQLPIEKTPYKRVYEGVLCGSHVSSFALMRDIDTSRLTPPVRRHKKQAAAKVQLSSLNNERHVLFVKLKKYCLFNENNRNYSNGK